MSYRKNRRLEDSYTLKPLSRRSILDKQRALAGAHNEAETKLGNLILRPVNDPIYKREVTRIEQDGQRLHTDMEIQKKQLMKRLTLLPEPTVILRRPKSKEETKETPTVRLTTSLPSLDAFTVKGKKKRNVWERKLLTPPNLLSIHMPCKPLSDAEEREIYLRNALLLPRPGTKGRHSTLRTRLSQPVQGTKTSEPSGNVLLREPISAHTNLKSLRLKSKTPREESIFVTEIQTPSQVQTPNHFQTPSSGLSNSERLLRRVQFDDESVVETVAAINEEPEERACHHPVFVMVHEDKPNKDAAAYKLDRSEDTTENLKEVVNETIVGKTISDELMVKGVK